MLQKLALVFVLFWGIAGCSPKLTSARLTEQQLPAGAKIAVLPFENLSGKEGASEKITEYFVMALQGKKNIEICEFGEVYNHMRQYRVRSTSLLTSNQIDSLSFALGINYVVAGSVLDFRETDNQYLGKVPQVSLNVRLIDCGSHKTVWTGVVNARGDQSEWIFGIGAVRSLEELAHSVVNRAADNIGSMFRK
jgi:TolB-like protein